MGRVVSPTPTPLSSGRVVPALVASYDMHGRAVGLFYTQPTGQGQVSCLVENFVLHITCNLSIKFSHTLRAYRHHQLVPLYTIVNDLGFACGH